MSTWVMRVVAILKSLATPPVTVLVVLVILLVGILIAAPNTRKFMRFLKAPPSPSLVPWSKEACQNLLSTWSHFWPESKFVEIDGLKLHFVQAGEGRDLVLLHGIGASVHIWRFLFAALCGQAAGEKFRVTAIDLLGFGKSAKPRGADYGLDRQTEIVAKAISSLNLKDPLVIGSSMGGSIALWLGKKYPDLFPKLMVLSPHTEATVVPHTAKYLTLARPVLKRFINRESFRMFLGYVLARRSLITDELVDAYLEPFLDEGDALNSFFLATALLADRRLPRELSTVTSDVLVIYGEKDFMVTRKSVETLATLLPNSRLVTHPEGGHHIMEDEPIWLCEQIIEFSHSPKIASTLTAQASSEELAAPASSKKPGAHASSKSPQT